MLSLYIEKTAVFLRSQKITYALDCVSLNAVKVPKDTAIIINNLLLVSQRMVPPNGTAIGIQRAIKKKL